MARQNTTPVDFKKSTRKDRVVTMSSARAGVVAPVAYVPLLAGDSCSGRFGIDVQLKEMPKPLLNAVHANVQAWFVPKSAFPKFSSRDELVFAMSGEQIKALGQPDRDAPPYFDVIASPGAPAQVGGDFLRTLGVHVPSDAQINTDVFDAFTLAYNFRLAAHSSRLPRRKYYAESWQEAKELPPAFWPSSRMKSVVPDYERALVVGSLDLDVAAGRVPVSGIGRHRHQPPVVDQNFPAREQGDVNRNYNWSVRFTDANGNNDKLAVRTASGGSPDVWAELGGESVSVSLADIDKARTTQAFAKLRTSYAGNDATGFDNDDAIVAMLMQGLEVPADSFKRPWLLDSKRVPIGFAERFATDAANLDQSVTVGRASASLSLNVPQQDVGGMIIVTVEVLPERVDERMADEYLYCTAYDDLPNALRDIQRVEPVDMVRARRVDAKHEFPNSLYGYEPMNNKWNRDFTRLGGDFYAENPGDGWTENRSNIWQTEIVNPTFSKHHYLAPTPFPHDVFADSTADAFEFVARHDLTIVGLTQIGDVLAENNDDYEAIADSGN